MPHLPTATTMLLLQSHMTTLRLTCALLLALPVSALQEGAAGVHVLPVPSWALPGPPVQQVPALDSGIHLDPRPEGRPGQPGGVGAALPLALLEAMLNQQLTALASGASVQGSTGALVVRGDETARDLVRSELDSLARQLAALEVEVGVQLRIGEELVLDEQVRATSGDELQLGARSTTPYVGSYRARVAADSAAADPELHRLIEGATLHLRVLRTGDGSRVRLEGFLDVTRRVPEEEPGYDAGLPEFEHLVLPVVDTLQVAFTGSVDGTDEQDQLGLDVRGELCGIGAVELRVSARSRPAIDPAGDGHWRVCDVADLARAPRRLAPFEPGHGAELPGEATLVASRSALSPSALIPLLGPRQASREARPLWTDRLLLLPPSASSGSLRTALQGLRAELAGARDGEGALNITDPRLQARLPLTQGYPARLVVGRETALVIDYDTELAPETWLAEPVVERCFDGLGLDATLQDGLLRASSWMLRSDPVVEVAPDGNALGRLLLPTRHLAASPGELRPGEPVSLLSGSMSSTLELSSR